MEILIIVLIIAIVIIIPNIKIVPQSKAYVVERIGSYLTTWHNGLHFKIPFIDRIANTVVLKEMVRDFEPQPVITKDNVTMQIDTVVYFQITDPKLYTYGVEYPISAIESLTATTLRNIIGELELDQTLTSRDIINSKMRAILDEATDPWGIKVNRVEVKNILPQAEGEKKSSILIAEGEKESAILRAEAEKESRIKRAEGEAEALLKIKNAEAEGIRLLKEAGADHAVLQLKSYETLSKMADGNATKIILPAELSNVATFGTVLQESLNDSTKTIKKGPRE